jgi:broad specificity phosphatase PhoE
MTMRGIRLSLLYALFAVLTVAGGSRPASAQAEWISGLRQGGYVIVFRHGATTSDKTKDSMSNPGAKNAGERQLNDEGRAQAKAIGASMHKLGIPVATVMTSSLQRAIDTGTLLGFGEATPTVDLAEAGPALAPEENNRRAQAFRALVTARPPAGKNTVIVSHKPNIVDAFGKDFADIHEAEAAIFQADGQGGYKLIVRVKPEEWGNLAPVSN